MEMGRLSKGGMVLSICVVLVLTALTACVQKEVLPPPPAPTLSEHLDQLYETNKLEWRKEMKQLLRDESVTIPTRHLALAIKAFNNQANRDLCLEATWRYLRAKAGNGPRLASENDRKLLQSYADIALSTNNQLMIQRMKKLCVILEDEDVCKAFK